jgi:hypothetical protein
MSHLHGKNHRKSGFRSFQRTMLHHQVVEITSSRPDSPPDALDRRLVRLGRKVKELSAPDVNRLRAWLTAYLKPVLETMDGQEVERQSPTEESRA